MDGSEQRNRFFIFLDSVLPGSWVMRVVLPKSRYQRLASPNACLVLIGGLTQFVDSNRVRFRSCALTRKLQVEVIRARYRGNEVQPKGADRARQLLDLSAIGVKQGDLNIRS